MPAFRVLQVTYLSDVSSTTVIGQASTEVLPPLVDQAFLEDSA
jgi:hypothetical protein